MKLMAIFVLALASLAAAKDYSVQSAELDYYLNPDGTINVVEHITYDLDGSFYQLYVQKPLDLDIENASGYCARKECTFSQVPYEGWDELRLDGDFQDERIDAYFMYTVKGEILEQKDASQFFYKLWGDQWEKGVGTIDARIHLPGDVSQASYFMHPPGRDYRVNASGRTLEIVSVDHPAKTYLELNLVMPKGWFSGLRRAERYMTRSEIEDGERAYARNEAIVGFLRMILTIIAFAALPLAFIFAYLRFGTEKPLSSLGYLAEYEREPPGPLSPAQVSYLLDPQGEGFRPEALSAEMLALVHSGHLEMEEREVIKKGLLGERKEKKLCFRCTEKDTATLNGAQAALRAFIASKETDGWFSVDGFSDQKNAVSLRILAKNFDSSVKSWFKGTNYIDGRGNNLVMGLAGLLLVVSVVMLLVVEGDPVGILLLVESIAFLLLASLKPTLLGRWSDEGRVAEAKWKNFKKFLNDYTLLREKAPRDMAVWEEYLIYATGFGIADKVQKAIKVVMPEEAGRSRLYSSYAFYPAMTRSISTGTSAATGGRASP